MIAVNVWINAFIVIEFIQKYIQWRLIDDQFTAYTLMPYHLVPNVKREINSNHSLKWYPKCS